MGIFLHNSRATFTFPVLTDGADRNKEEEELRRSLKRISKSENV